MNTTPFREWRPEIVLVPYDSKSKMADTQPDMPVQAEHPIPNSCFMMGPGREGATVPYTGTYSEGDALTFWVSDAQLAGTEHKFLTDAEKSFAADFEKSGTYPTVKEWFDHMEKTWAEAFLTFRIHSGDPQAEAKKRQAGAQAAAELRKTLENHYYETLGVNPNAKLRNGMVGGSPPQPYPEPEGDTTKAASTSMRQKRFS